MQHLRWRGNRARRGFTLLELLTSLMVMGVASTILLKMFLSSASLAKTSATHEIAADLAQEYSTLLQARPELFTWPNFAEVKPGESAEIKAKDVNAVPNSAEPPAALPLLRRAHDRDIGAYRDYTWKANGRLPAPDAQYVAVTVEVQWEMEGRIRQFDLETAIPRSAVEKARQ